MPEKRERWDSRGAFVMAAIGSAIGLGNVWRFPYIAGQNGGGAFFIPYFVALLTAGIPLMILEYALGAKFQGSAARSFRQWGKGWEWLGWWGLMVGSIISFYYCAVMAWSWQYLYHSTATLFTGSELPWAQDAGKFFYQDVLHLPGGLAVNKLVWPLVGGLAFTWFVIWWVIHRGVKRVGKIVMLTVPLPFLILIILFVRGITLDGAAEGLNYYLAPQWHLLLEPEVWLAAYGQIFFSLSLGFGILIAYASYLPKRADIANNAFITSFSNCATSFFAGLVVFSTVGFLAQSQGIPVAEIGTKGPSLAFVTYPTAIAQIDMGNSMLAVVAIFFFLMLLSLGIDSAFSIVEGMVTGLHDKFRARRGTICAVMCFVGFLAGLLFVTDAGLYYLDIVDHWMNGFGLAAIGLMECVAVGWFVGRKRLGRILTRKEVNPIRAHVNEVSDFRVGWWWDLCIMVITPAVLATLLVLNFIEDFEEPYEGYASWARYIFGWGTAVAVVALGVFFMVLRGAGESGTDDGEEVEG